MSTPLTTEAALAQLNQPERVEPQAPEPAAPIPTAEPAPLNVEDEAAVQAALDANAIQVPDGDSLVPSSDVGKVAQSYRAQIKTLKAEIGTLKDGSAKAQQLEQQVAQLTQAVQQMQPYVQAYQQLQQQQPTTPATPKEPEVSDDDANNYARLYDLYKADGSGQLDTERGRRIVLDMRKMASDAAEQAAEKRVAPIQAQTVQQQSSYMLARAKNTVLPNGVTVDPKALDTIWQRLDPTVTATTEGAQWALIAALGTQFGMASPEQLATLSKPQAPTRGPNGQFVAAPPAPPAHIPEAIPREPSGGLTPQGQSPLSDQERKFLSATGMSEADYMKQAGNRFGAR